ncbi:hypothetical protein D3C81_2099460 [compost metagenome]
MDDIGLLRSIVGYVVLNGQQMQRGGAGAELLLQRSVRLGWAVVEDDVARQLVGDQVGDHG